MYLLSSIPPISIKASPVFEIFGLSITNSMLTLFLVNIILLALALFIKKGSGLIPSRLQVITESIFGFFNSSLEPAFGDKETARKFLPLIMTLFLVIFFANQISLLPILMDLKLGSGANLFRVPTSDFSLTIALALIVVVLSHLIALRIAPVKHVLNMTKIGEILKVRSVKDLTNLFLELFLGVLDLIGEVAKIVSLSARLFGNVLAGELMVLIITYLGVYTAYFIPIPFIFLSAFSGVVQAIIFPMLTIQYIAGMRASVKN